jgi:hypothetical protein
MDTGQLVVVSCTSPREKFWGVLLQLNAVGATVRAVAVGSFEDWLRQWSAPAEQLIGPATVFLPLHRIERIEVDETSGVVEGMGERFRRVAGLEPREALMGEAQPPEPARRQM